MNPNNQITVIGNVGEVPEVKTKTKAGKNVVAFAVAQNVTSIDPESRERVQRDPQWFRVTCFGSLADRVVTNVKKGDLLFVVGQLKARSYNDKGGVKRLTFEIVAGDALKVERLRSAREEKDKIIDTDMPNFDEFTSDRVSS